MSNSPVLAADEQAGATPVRRHYSSVLGERQALYTGAGLLDRSNVGRLALTGEGALDLLNRLSTNDLSRLQAGQGTFTVLTTNKGRILDLLHVLRLPERLLVTTARESRQRVIDWIDLYTIMEDVAVRDITEETAMLSVAGPQSATFLDALTGADTSSLGRYDSMVATIDGVEATLVRSDFVGVPGYDLVVAATEGQPLWAELVVRGETDNATPIGSQALELVRVEQGVPAYGRELSEDFNPLEAGLTEFISPTKGCYVGQEVVARLITYKKVQKELVGLRWDSDVSPVRNAKLMLQMRQVGVLTSAVEAPQTGESIGLGYVRKAHAQPGTVLALETGERQVDVEVAALPFDAAQSQAR